MICVRVRRQDFGRLRLLEASNNFPVASRTFRIHRASSVRYRAFRHHLLLLLLVVENGGLVLSHLVAMVASYMGFDRLDVRTIWCLRGYRLVPFDHDLRYVLLY